MIDAKTYKNFGEQFLDDIIKWIGEHLKPEDVFSKDKLLDWADEEGYLHRGD
jgi:hypothetical protein